MIKKKDRNYVNGPKLHQALVDWYAAGTEEPPMVIVTAIIQICERLGTKNNFKNYTYLEEMIGEAKLACILAVQQKKYDPEKGNNPFAYFTRIASNEFIRIIKFEQKQTYIKHEELQSYMVDAAARGEIIEYSQDDSGRLDDLVRKFRKPEDEYEPTEED